MPFITSHWTYIGMPKTGSHFIHTIFIELFGKKGFTASFETYEEAPAEWKTLPTICTMRNPWAWHVSHWEWFRDEHHQGDRRSISNGKEFEEWLKANPNIMEDEIQLHYPPDAHIVRIEYIADDLIETLNSLEPEPLSVSVCTKIQNTPPLNLNPKIKRRYMSYYTSPESREIVLHNAARIFAQFYPSLESIEWSDRPE